MYKWLCEDTARILMNEQIAYYYPYGGEKVRFEQEELKTIKTLDSSGYLFVNLLMLDLL